MAARLGIILILLLSTSFASCSSDKHPGPDATPPAAVTDLALLGADETSATLTWSAPGDDGDKGQAASYDLRYSLSALPAAWDTATVVQGLPIPRQAGLAETVTVSGLTRDLIYYFALATTDDAGNTSDLSNIVQVQTADPTPPGQVTDLHVTGVEMEAVTLQFTAPGDDGATGTATRYDVRYGPDPVTEQTWAQSTVFPVAQAPHAAGTTETIRVTGLTPEATLHFGVRAQDDGGQWSAVSNDVEATLLGDTTPPATITDLVVSGTVPFTLTLSWTAPGDDGREGQAASYEIRYATAAITAPTWPAATSVTVTLTPKPAGQREEVTLTDLPGDKTLWFCVRAMDEKGNESLISNASKGYVRRTPRTWVVRVDGGGDAPTVQAGIDSSRSGDTVTVLPGTYYENIDFMGRDILLHSAEGPEVTILDGSLGDSSVVIFKRGETRAAVLMGFTITGGMGSNFGGTLDGGGVYCANSSPTIRGNRISGNGNLDRRGMGGGILAATWADVPILAAPLIEGNTFEENESGQNGGGLGLGDGAFEVRNNVFRNNLGHSDGGGIWLWTRRGYAIIEDNQFWDNVAGDHGGGIYSAGRQGSDPIVIQGNLLVGNRTVGTGFRGDTGSGGAIAALLMRGVIRHNTLVGNDGQHLTQCGGGGLLLYLTGDELSVYGNLIAFNEECGIACWDGTATMGPNLLWANGGGDLGTGLGECASEWGGALLFADPLFCDPENGDYRVASNSPALTGEEVMGAYSEPGCGPRNSVQTSSWNRLRGRTGPMRPRPSSPTTSPRTPSE